jgi:hypothetical protein
MQETLGVDHLTNTKAEAVTVAGFAFRTRRRAAQVFGLWAPGSSLLCHPQADLGLVAAIGQACYLCLDKVSCVATGVLLHG